MSFFSGFFGINSQYQIHNIKFTTSNSQHIQNQFKTQRL